MSDFLSIGKVSKLKNVSIKSLRYYDEIGIFKPAYINSQTNYRYYTTEQLPLLDAISLCIEIGIPLKDFVKYRDEKGEVDLHRLLCDGKIIAEEKIKAMGKRLETLSNTIYELENKSVSPLFETKELTSRTVLAIPFDENTTTEHYTHLILKLFVEAQRLNLSASYPSGFLYEQSNGRLIKYVFLLLHAEAAIPSSLCAPYRIFSLVAGSYYYNQSKEHQIEEGTNTFGALLHGKSRFILLETDLLSDNDINKFELQLLAQEAI